MRKLLLLLPILFCLLPVQSWAAATFSNQCSVAANGASPKSLAGCNISGSNRVVIGTAIFSTNMATVGTVTFKLDSVTLTQIQCVDYNSAARSLCLFGIVAPAGNGSATIDISWTGGHNGTTYYGLVDVAGADQSQGWQNVGQDSGTGTDASSTVTTANNNLVVVAHANNNASSTTINLGSSAWINTSGNTNGAQGYLASTTSSSVVSWTLGSSVDWANLKVDVCAIGGCSAAGSSKNMMMLGVQ